MCELSSWHFVWVFVHDFLKGFIYALSRLLERKGHSDCPAEQPLSGTCHVPCPFGGQLEHSVFWWLCLLPENDVRISPQSFGDPKIRSVWAPGSPRFLQLLRD